MIDREGVEIQYEAVGTRRGDRGNESRMMDCSGDDGVKVRLNECTPLSWKL
jgi:hypothetical protein